MEQNFDPGVRPADAVLAQYDQVLAIETSLNRIIDAFHLADTSLIKAAMEALRPLQQLDHQLERAGMLLQEAVDPNMLNALVGEAVESVRAQASFELDNSPDEFPGRNICQRHSDLRRTVDFSEGPMPQVLSVGVQEELFKRAQRHVYACRVRLWYWCNYQQFPHAKAITSLDDNAARVNDIQATTCPIGALKLSHDRLGRVLELLASGQCPDPAAFARDALQFDFWTQWAGRK